MPKTRRVPAPAAVREAEQVRTDLRAALLAAGISLPSLRLDPVTCVPETQGVLIDLGRCNLDTARALTAALTGRRPAATGGQPRPEAP